MHSSGLLITVKECRVCEDDAGSSASVASLDLAVVRGTFQVRMEPKQSVVQAVSVMLSGVATLVSMLRLSYARLEQGWRWLTACVSRRKRTKRVERMDGGVELGSLLYVVWETLCM